MKPGDRAHNQAHYEALGDVITEEVYNHLQIVGGLERKEVVLGDGSRKGPQSFVFVSPGFQEKERLQVVSKSYMKSLDLKRRRIQSLKMKTKFCKKVRPVIQI